MNVIKLDDFPQCPEQDGIYEIIPNKTKIVAYTNKIFNKYPTRYVSAVPRFGISKYSKEGDTVLDPFCGSGTTAIEALVLGRNALSCDIDEFSRLLIRVKTHIYSEDELEKIYNFYEMMLNTSFVYCKDMKYPEISNIDKWFSQDAIDKLAYVKARIDSYSDDLPVKDFLYVVLAGIIRKASNAEEVSPKPYISTRFPKQPEDALVLFKKYFELYYKAISDFSKMLSGKMCKSIVLESKDSRRLNCQCSVDLAVTSPPYINAYDYVRSLKFEDLWLDLISEKDLRNSRKFYIGTESASSFCNEYKYANQSETLMNAVEIIKKVDVRRAQIVMTYFEDMTLNMLSVKEWLKNKGYYMIVVGDSNIRGVNIPTSKILTEIAEKYGYEYQLGFKYIIRDRYLHLPRGNRGGIIKYDEIICLCKK